MYCHYSIHQKEKETELHGALLMKNISEIPILNHHLRGKILTIDWKLEWTEEL